MRHPAGPDDHVFHPWSAQRHVELPVVTHARGSHFWDADGHRYLDFASQLVNLNIGHQHPAVVDAVRRQAETLCTLAPTLGSDVRAEAAGLIAGVAPAGLNAVFFTSGGAEATENAIRMARLHTGRHKIMAAYRSYHGATAGAITLTGDPRRWPAEPGMPGVVHFWGPYPYRSPFTAGTGNGPEAECELALSHLRQTMLAEGPEEIAAVIVEPVVGTNGVLVPPEGYLAGVRSLCDEFGALLIADEVMTGFGRCGEWFAVDHWSVVPDLITFAKGVNSGYVPLGGVLISDEVARSFADRPYPGGLTYSGHPLACAAAVAAITVLREDGIVDHARGLGRDVLGPALAGLAADHPSVGDVRGLGVFWAVELVSDRDSRAPVPAEVMGELTEACRAAGLWPFVHGNRVHVVPPCTVTADEVADGVGILDRALKVVDRHYGK